MATLASYPWPLKPFDQQHPVRGFFCDPRIADGGRTFHFGIDIAAPAGTPVYAVAAGKVSFGLPSDVAQNGGIVVVEAQGRNFGYWHVAPAVAAGTRLPLHALLGHVSDRPEDWGHVHFAESTRGQDGITYWNPLRSGAFIPVPRLRATRDRRDHHLAPAQRSSRTRRPLRQGARQHTDRDHPAQPPGWHGLPVTPARIRWRLSHGSQTIVPWQTSVEHGSALHPDIRGNPPTDINFASVYAPDTTQNTPSTPGTYHFWLKRRFDTRPIPNGNYTLEVEASDVRGNPRTATRAIVIKN